MRGRKLAMVLVMFGILVGMATMAQATVIFSDDFESHTDVATTWVEDADRDPGVPPVGAGWTIRESNYDYQVQVWRDPVPNGAIQTPYGDQFLHMWRSGSEAYTEAWGGLTTAAQTEIAANGNMRSEFYVYVMSTDGWGGNLSFHGFDSAPGVYAGRAFSVTFCGDGVVKLYTGTTVQYEDLDAVFDTDTWEHVIIDADFTTDTWSITIDDVTKSGLAFAGGDLSKIQQLLLAATDRSGNPGRGGFDNVLAETPVPEPTTMGLLTVGGLGVLIRRKRR